MTSATQPTLSPSLTFKGLLPKERQERHLLWISASKAQENAGFDRKVRSLLSNLLQHTEGGLPTACGQHWAGRVESER